MPGHCSYADSRPIKSQMFGTEGGTGTVQSQANLAPSTDSRLGPEEWPLLEEEQPISHLNTWGMATTPHMLGRHGTLLQKISHIALCLFETELSKERVHQEGAVHIPHCVQPPSFGEHPREHTTLWHGLKELEERQLGKNKKKKCWPSRNSPFSSCHGLGLGLS